MVEWLFKPKVQLGLLVNFIFVMFTLVSSLAGPPTPERLRPAATYEAPAVPYAPLPPLAAPSRAVSSMSGGRINVQLDNALTLFRKPGHMLLLSPSLSAPGRPAEQPPLVTMRFITLPEDEDEVCPGACMLVINADGKRVLESATSGTFASGWKREKIPAMTTVLAGKAVTTLPVETLTAQVPYDMFLEIISARRVVISLGPDKVELTHDQIEVLRDMQRLVTPPPAEEPAPKVVVIKTP